MVALGIPAREERCTHLTSSPTDGIRSTSQRALRRLYRTLSERIWSEAMVSVLTVGLLGQQAYPAARGGHTMTGIGAHALVCGGYE